MHSNWQYVLLGGDKIRLSCAVGPIDAQEHVAGASDPPVFCSHIHVELVCISLFLASQQGRSFDRIQMTNSSL